MLVIFATRSLIEANTLFSIETVNGRKIALGDIVIDAENEGFITIEGWAIDEPARRVAGGIWVNIDGKEILAFYGKERADISNNLGNSYYQLCGFSVALDPQTLGKGEHILFLKILTADKQGYYIPEKVLKIVIH